MYLDRYIDSYDIEECVDRGNVVREKVVRKKIIHFENKNYSLLKKFIMIDQLFSE